MSDQSVYDYKQQILTRLENRTAIIGIIGMGYVGFPLAVAFAEAGFRVIGVDLSKHKVEAVNRGESYIIDISSARVKPLVDAQRLMATTDYAALAEADCISICVPTPLNATRDPDMSYVEYAVQHLATVAHAGMLVALESTVYPRATEEVILPPLTQNGLKVGAEIFIAFSPERISPGDKNFGVHNIPKLVGGITPNCAEVTAAYYSIVINPIAQVSSAIVAELSKLLENTFRAVNIGLVNEMAIMCNYLGVNVWEVIDAAATKPFGFMPHYPGPGIGGHCIPLDPHYLSWKLRQFNYHARFVEVASEINSRMPSFVVEKTVDALNDDAKAVKHSRIGILGMAYKPDIDDVRESPSFEIIEHLTKKGALIEWHDPHVEQLYLLGEISTRAELTATWLQSLDVVIIVTHHRVYDWQLIVDHSRLVVDTRNVTKGLHGQARIVGL